MQTLYALRSFLLFIMVVITSALYAQEPPTDEPTLDELYAELDSVFSEEVVPEDLFALVDSLIASENEKVSALNVRLGYVSTVVSAGRTFGIEQFGIMPAVNYFHHSGFFGGATGYWSNEYSPEYYLTNLSVGYSHTFKQKISITANHDFYLFNDTLGDHSFDKSAEVALNYQFKKFDIGGDYAFLYGNDQAHRVTAVANARFKIKMHGFLDAITFMPGASFQWGNANVLFIRQPRTAVSDLYYIVKGNNFPKLTLREYIRLTNMLENDRTGQARYFLLQREYRPQQIATLLGLYYDGQFFENDTFGFMNYSISLPVVFRAKRWSLLLNYTYNVPQSLPGETFTYEPSGYFSSSLSYLVYWVKKE